MPEMRHFVIMATVLACGCGTTVRYTPTNTPPHPASPRDPSSVEVFTAGPPQRPYVEVGFFEAQQSSTWSLDDRGAIIENMREEAGRAGCDGLVVTGNADNVVGSSSGSTVNGTGSTHGSVSTLEGFRGSCIMFTVVEAAAPPPPPQQTIPGCVPGATQACVGPGGCTGGQSCNPDGRSFSTCDCGPSPTAEPTTAEPTAAEPAAAAAPTEGVPAN